MDMDKRPDWDEFFLGMAFYVSMRSRDIHTWHGSVLVDSENHVLSTGYNSFAANMYDENLPLNRPEFEGQESKYDHMIHSEENMVNNCRIDRWSIPDLRAYITGLPCYKCCRLLYTSNIRHVIYYDGYVWQNTEKEKTIYDRFLSNTKMPIKLVPMKIDLSFLGDKYKKLIDKRMRQ